MLTLPRNGASIYVNLRVQIGIAIAIGTSELIDSKRTPDWATQKAKERCFMR
jgi:hypothetical protein